MPHHDYTKVEWMEPESPDAEREHTSGHSSPHFFRRGEHQVKYTFSDGINTKECTFMVVILGITFVCFYLCNCSNSFKGL